MNMVCNKTVLYAINLRTSLFILGISAFFLFIIAYLIWRQAQDNRTSWQMETDQKLFTELEGRHLLASQKMTERIIAERELSASLPKIETPMEVPIAAVAKSKSSK